MVENNDVSVMAPIVIAIGAAASQSVEICRDAIGAKTQLATGGALVQNSMLSKLAKRNCER